MAQRLIEVFKRRLTLQQKVNEVAQGPKNVKNKAILKRWKDNVAGHMTHRSARKEISKRTQKTSKVLQKILADKYFVGFSHKFVQFSRGFFLQIFENIFIFEHCKPLISFVSRQFYILTKAVNGLRKLQCKVQDYF